MRKKTAIQLATPQSPRWQALINGDITVEDLDIEELMRGQLRDKNGGFRGNTAQLVPRRLHLAMVQELHVRVEKMFMEHIEDAVETMLEVMKYGETRDMVRLQAAQYWIERVVGKIPNGERTIQATPTWQKAIESGELLVDIDDNGDEEIVEAEVIEEPRRPVRRRNQRQ